MGVEFIGIAGRGFCVSLLALACARTSHAQVVYDGTTGPPGSLFGPDYLILQADGTLVGSNLFHSFSLFNVHTGESATFSGSAGILNVLARVTGGSMSTIDGRLATSGMPGVSLFLINPSGVLFGAGAEIDVPGAFAVTTADVLHLEDGGSFNATNPGDSLLTSAMPNAFGFLDDNLGSVTIEGSLLAMDEGQVLSVVAGDIRIEGGTLVAPSGRVNLVSGASSGTVELDATSRNADGAFDSFTSRGDIRLLGSTIDVEGAGGGRIDVRGNDLVMLDDARLLIGNESESGGGGGIDLTGELRMRDGSTIRTASYGDAAGGELDIVADTLSLKSGASITSVAFENGAGGDVRLAADVIDVLDGSEISSLLEGIGSGGDIDIEAGTLTVCDAEVSSRVGFGIGVGGDIRIEADAIAVENDGLIAASLESTRIGDTVEYEDVPSLVPELAGGSVSIAAGSLVVSGGGEISTGAVYGTAGDVGITADEIHVTGESSRIAAVAAGLGNGGALDIDAGALNLRDGAGVQVLSVGSGASGDLHVIADELVLKTSAFMGSYVTGSGNGGNVDLETGALTIDGAEIESVVFQSATGLGGDVSISADTIVVRAGGAIQSNMDGVGAGGSIDIDTGALTVSGLGSEISSRVDFGTGSSGDVDIEADSIRIKSGGLIESAIGPGGAGNGGDLRIRTDSLRMSSGAEIITLTYLGTAGDIDIEATEVRLTDDFTSIGSIAFDPYLTGGILAGELSIDTVTLRLVDGAALGLGDSFSDGVGGVHVVASESVVIDNARITTEVLTDADGGDISIETGMLRIKNGGAISASAEGFFSLGNAGAIQINADEVKMSEQSGIFSSTSSMGDAGVIDINTAILRMDSNSRIRSCTFTSGDAGDVLVSASDIKLANGAFIQSAAEMFSSGNGGSVVIDATTLRLIAGSSISADTIGIGNGGSISIDAQVVDVDNSGITAGTLFAGGTGGSVTIESSQLSVRNDGLITTSSLLSGNAGAITIDTDSMLVDGQSFVATGADGNPFASGGDVSIQAKDIRVLGGSVITTASIEAGASGQIDIIADRVLVSESSAIRSDSFLSGNAGDITIDARTITVKAGSAILSSTEGFFGGGAAGDIDLRVNHLVIDGESTVTSESFDGGDAGDITIAAKTILVDGRSSISSETCAFGEGGDGGDIDIQAKRLEILGDSGVTSTTIDAGAAGNISVVADTVVIRGTATTTVPMTAAQVQELIISGDIAGIAAVTEADLTDSDVSGDGGNIDIRAGSLTIEGQAGIGAGSRSTGNGGDIFIQADSLTMRNSAGIVAGSQLESDDAGSAGGITINAGSIALSEFSLIATAAIQADAGGINLTSATDITLQDSAIAANALLDGGNIKLTAPGLLFLRDSAVTTQAGGSGGNIVIDPQFVIIESSQLRADAQLGNGGNITIVADFFLPSESTISASSQFGVAGAIEIVSPDLDLSGSLVELPGSLIRAEARLREECAARFRGGASSLQISGRNSPPNEPGGWLPLAGTIDARRFE